MIVGILIWFKVYSLVKGYWSLWARKRVKSHDDDDEAHNGDDEQVTTMASTKSDET